MSIEVEKHDNERQEHTPDPEEKAQILRRTPYYTLILVTCIALVFLAQMGTDLETSARLASFDKILFNDGEYWRLLTGIALHGSILHLGFNSYALFVLGRLMEMIANRSHVAIVFLLSGIGGGVLSLFMAPEIPTLGASGGVIGLLGYLTVYGYKRRKLLPESFLRNMLFNIALIGFVGFLLIDKIDNFGHLGGLLTGAIYGMIQIPADLYKDPRATSKTTDLLGIISLGIFISISLFAILIITGIISL